jgi:hypothetical protein
MRKFLIEAYEKIVYQVEIEAEDYHDAQEKFWSEYPDLISFKTENAVITFIGESQQ